MRYHKGISSLFSMLRAAGCCREEAGKGRGEFPGKASGDVAHDVGWKEVREEPLSSEGAHGIGWGPVGT